MNTKTRRSAVVFLLAGILFLFTARPYEADRKVIRPARPNEPPAQSSAPRLGGILSPGIMTATRSTARVPGVETPRLANIRRALRPR